MALSEGSWTEQPATKPRYSTGNVHSSAIKKALQAKRVAVRHAPEMVRGLVEIANDTKQPGSTRVVAMQAVLERGLGKPSMAPEDAAVQLQSAAILADMRPALALKLWPSQIDQSAPHPLIAATVIEQDDTAK